MIKGEKGAFSAVWMVLILSVIGLSLFSIEILNENITAVGDERNFLQKKMEIESLEEQTKLRGYLLMEKAVMNAVAHIETEEETEERELERIYRERINWYLSREIRADGISTKERLDIAYIEGHTETYERPYSYDYRCEELIVKCEDISDEDDESRKKYSVSYYLKESRDDIGYRISPVILVMEYPGYREATSGEPYMLNSVKIVKTSFGEG